VLRFISPTLHTQITTNLKSKNVGLVKRSPTYKNFRYLQIKERWAGEAQPNLQNWFPAYAGMTMLPAI